MNLAGISIAWGVFFALLAGIRIFCG